MAISKFSAIFRSFRIQSTDSECTSYRKRSMPIMLEIHWLEISKEIQVLDRKMANSCLYSVRIVIKMSWQIS